MLGYYGNGKSLSAYTVPCLILVMVAPFLVSTNSVFWVLDQMLDQLQDNELIDNPYVQGNFAPVAEERHASEMEIVFGALPEELDGMIVRNGPNPIPEQLSKRYLWFDGHGMLHIVRLRDGKALYSNAYVRTPRYEYEAKHGYESFLRLGELDGFVGILKGVLNYFKLKLLGISLEQCGQANTHTIMLGNRFYALHEASLPFEVRLLEDGGIESLGYDDFDGLLDFPVSAHPKVDRATGNFIFHSYSVRHAYELGKAPIKAGEYVPDAKHMKFYLGVNPLDKHVSFAHDIAFTTNFLVVYDSSVHFSPESIMNKSEDFLSFNREHTFRIGLIPRKKNVHWDEIHWFDTTIPLAVVHLLNAWEEVETGNVVLWAPVSSDFSFRSGLFNMAEFNMNIREGSVDMRLVDKSLNAEFCIVRDECYGIFCPYGYTGIMIQDPSLGAIGLFEGFAVWDMAAGKLLKAVYFPPGHIGQEPLVIPKQPKEHLNLSLPEQPVSDDVYIGIFMHNTLRNESYFSLFDGKHDSGLPLVAKLKFPVRVPYGFHSQWVGGRALRAHLAFHQRKTAE